MNETSPSTPESNFRTTQENYHEDKESFESTSIFDIPKNLTEKYSFVLDSLPKNVAIEGSLARNITREALTGESEDFRDIDLVHIKEAGEISPEERSRLSNEFMPDDSAFGYGIESVGIKDYFQTRDFTINQCLVMDGKILLTEQAKEDIINNIVRPSKFEIDEDGDVGDRIYCKAHMIWATLYDSDISKDPKMEDVKTWGIPGDFKIALFLNKAMSRNKNVAHLYVNSLVDSGDIGEKFRDEPKKLAIHLRDNLYNFYFRQTQYNQEHGSGHSDKKDYWENDEQIYDDLFLPESALRMVDLSDPDIRSSVFDMLQNKKEAGMHESIVKSDQSRYDPDYYTKSDFRDINQDTPTRENGSEIKWTSQSDDW